MDGIHFIKVTNSQLQTVSMAPTRADYISQKSLTRMTGQGNRIHDRHSCIMPP
jgi:hypothetical protein